MTLDSRVHYLKHPLAEIWTGITILDDVRLVIIDSGTQSAVSQTILPFLQEHDLRDRRDSLVINTHCHCDHIGGNAGLKRALGSEIAAHRDDVPAIEDRKKQFEALFGVFIDQTGFSVNLAGFMEIAGQDVPVDRVLEERELVETGTRSLRVIHTPGHSEGCIVLLDESTETAFAGDSFQCDGTTDTRVPLITDAAAYRASIEKVRGYDIQTMVVDHPFKPYSHAILSGPEVGEFLQASLDWLDHYDRQVLAFITQHSGEEVTLRAVAEHMGAQSDIPLNPYVCMLAGALIDVHCTDARIQRTVGSGYDPNCLLQIS